MTLSFEEKMEKAYTMAEARYEGFQTMEPEEQYYLAYDFFQEISWQEEAEYWTPILRDMEREEKRSQFDNPADLYEWEAGESE